MKINQLLNNKEVTLKSQRRDKMEYLNKILGKPQHLNWKEKKRELALRRKSLRIGLTLDEKQEWEDLNSIEVIAEGKNIPCEKQNNKKEIIKEKEQKMNLKGRIQTRSMTRKFEKEIRDTIKESLSNLSK
jgi:Mg2+/Co2+ transporter CorB